jgi:GAF domain-containing protein
MWTRHQEGSGHVGDTLLRERTVIGRVLATEEPVLVNMLPGDPDAEAGAEREILAPCAAIGAPLKHHGQLFGVVAATREPPGHFSENSLRLLRSIGERRWPSQRPASRGAASADLRHG